MRFDWLLPNIKGIPVLMYHRIWPAQPDGLTVTPENLRQQWTFLKNEGYECLTIKRFLAISRNEIPAPQKAFLLTFDDGYRNNLEHLVPILKEFSWEALLFIIAGTLDGTVSLNLSDPIDAKLNVEELRQIAGKQVRLGLHGYQHENFKENSIEKLTEILRKSCEILDTLELPYEKILAYPYGARPKDANDFFRLKAWMSEYGIEAAFRIGNKPQRMPVLDFYELKRIDIRGEDSLQDFKIKLKKGKLKPF